MYVTVISVPILTLIFEFTSTEPLEHNDAERMYICKISFPGESPPTRSHS